MMDPFTGDARMLDAATFEDALTAFRREAKPTDVLVHGTEEQIQAMSTRIRLGNQEHRNRKARRKAQANARRRNRG